MAWTVSANGPTTTDGTEQVLVNDTTNARTFQFMIETHNMAAGDQVTVRIYKNVVGDGTQRVLYKQSFSGAQSADDIVKTSPAIASTNGVKVTLKRDLGTDRAYNWELIAA